MDDTWTAATTCGVVIVTLAGLGTGTCLWPMKVIRTLKFEHYWFIGMLPLVVVPWLVVLTMVPDPLGAYGELIAPDWRPLVIANLFAIGWGAANVLAGICAARIGFVLTGAILTGLGITVVVVLPFLVKGTGAFSKAPDLASAAGIAATAGVCVMLVGVVFTALAGFGRQRALEGRHEPDRQATGGFLAGLIMVVIAGVLSAGMPLAFVYGQGPIRDAMASHGAGEIPANMAVWAGGLFGGAMINILYPAVLMTVNRSWHVLGQCGRELFLSALIGTQLIISFALAGYGSLLLGALGASVGFGIQQATQIVGTQGVGFVSGEWRGVHGKPRRQMYTAIAILAVGVTILVCARTLAG